MEYKQGLPRDAWERLSALALALTATALVFAAISAGFTPHRADYAGRAMVHSTLAF